MDREIKKILDEIDVIMANNLDEENKIKNPKVINELSSKICDVQDKITNSDKNVDLNIENRFNVTASAIMSSQGKSNLDVNEANKYFMWLDNEKKNIGKNILSYEEAKTTSKYAIESGHDLSKKVKESLKQMNMSNISNLPKEPTWFDKFRGKIKKFFKKESGNKKTSPNLKEIKNDKYVKGEHNNFINDLSKYNTSISEYFKDETVVISDLHGNLDKWNMAKETLNENPKRKLIIEGDAMDRGQFGVEILMQIKDLCDKGRAEYIPGNHDVFAYNYLATKGSMFEDTGTHSKAKVLWELNGGKVTMSKFEDNNYSNIMEEELRSGRISNSISKDSLIEWLGNCPIQKKIKENGRDYALGHAMFDEELYQKYPNFNLRNALELELDGKEENKKILDKFNNCMWYRENDKNTHYSDISWPKDSIVVVGHTRQTEANLQYLQNDQNKPIVYLDCGKGELQGFNLSTSEHESIESNSAQKGKRRTYQR